MGAGENTNDPAPAFVDGMHDARAKKPMHPEKYRPNTLTRALYEDGYRYGATTTHNPNLWHRIRR